MGVKSFPTSKRKQKLQVKSKQNTIQYHYTDDPYNLNFVCSSEQFVNCQCFINHNVKTTSPAHWHKEIEIMHVLEGEGFIHISQSQKVTFNAPAIVIVPSNLVHRTFYPENSKVNRTLFSYDTLRLKESDDALDDCLNLLSNGELLHSIVIEEHDLGFKKCSAILDILESLSNAHKENSYDPVYAHNALPDSEDNDLIDFNKKQVNLESDEDSDDLEQDLDSCDLDIEDEVYEEPIRAQAINAGTIAIAAAQTFNNTNNIISYEREEIISESYVENIRLSGLMIQFKALLLNIIGCLLEYGYLVKFDSIRKPRMSSTNDERIKLLFNYIHENYNRQIKIKELASRLDVTNQYFCRFFKLLTDMSFIDYINDLRIQKATRDIVSTDLAIRDISVRHGFDSVGYFFKLFRARYDTTPTKYRLEHREAKRTQNVS